MKLIGVFVLAVTMLLSCNTSTSNTDPKQAEVKQDSLPIFGTWKLLTGTLIDNVKGDTVVTDYTKTLSQIKIINGDHFAFLGHNLDKSKTGPTDFSAGGGHYTLVGDQYTEFLEYCNDRQWENNTFMFTITVQNDTFTQKGIEKIDSIKVNRFNIEKYVRVK